MKTIKLSDDEISMLLVSLEFEIKRMEKLSESNEGLEKYIKARYALALRISRLNK